MRRRRKVVIASAAVVALVAAAVVWKIATRKDDPCPGNDGLHAGGTRYDDAVPFHMVTLRRQAMGRRRDLRPRFHPRPQLRVRRQGRLKR